MEIRLLGYQDIDFETDKGDRIVGINIFCASEDDYVTGHRTDKFFISKRLVPEEGLKPDCYYDLLFGRRGKVDKITYLGDVTL